MRIKCPHCSAPLALPEIAMGKTVCCPKCKKTFTGPLDTATGQPVEETEGTPEESALDQLAAASQSVSRDPRPRYSAPAQQFSPATGGAVRCPRCGSTQITSHQKGFGAGKACLGWMLSPVLAPVGLLCGFLGAKKILITCLACGYQWRAGKG